MDSQATLTPKYAPFSKLAVEQHAAQPAAALTKSSAMDSQATLTPKYAPFSNQVNLDIEFEYGGLQPGSAAALARCGASVERVLEELGLGFLLPVLAECGLDSCAAVQESNDLKRCVCSQLGLFLLLCSIHVCLSLCLSTAAHPGGWCRVLAEMTVSRTQIDLICRAILRGPALRPYQTFRLAVPPGSPLPLLEAESGLLDVHVCHGTLDQSACARARQLAEEHTAIHGWQTKRHDHHSTTDFPVKDSAALWSFVEPFMLNIVLPTMQELYFPGMDSALSRETLSLAIVDLFCVQYDAKGQRALGAHRDRSLLSFNVLLNEPKEFTGGGTHFEAMDRVVCPHSIGDLVVHSGQHLHSGTPITHGQRWLLVGFVKCPGANVRDSFIRSMHGKQVYTPD